MSRGGSYGGGQSSLGYLFGSDEQPNAPPPLRPVNLPPYGVDITTENPPDSGSAEKKQVSNNYHRAQGQNTGNFITDRPSTKVKQCQEGIHLSGTCLEISDASFSKICLPLLKGM